MENSSISESDVISTQDSHEGEDHANTLDFLMESPISDDHSEHEIYYENNPEYQLHVTPAIDESLADAPDTLLADFMSENPLSAATPEDTSEEVDVLNNYTFVDQDDLTETIDYFTFDESALTEATTESEDSYTPEYQTAYSFSEALEIGELREGYASAVILSKPLTKTDLITMRKLDYEVAIGVIEGQLVAFTSGQDHEIGTTSEAYRYLKDNASFLLHNHPDNFDGPSDVDLVKSLKSPNMEYVIDGNAIHAYNEDGILQTLGRTKLLENLNKKLMERPSDEAAAREALNKFIAEQDRYNEAHELDKTIFRGAESLVTPLNSQFLYINFHGAHFNKWGGYSNVTLGAYDRTSSSSFMGSYGNAGSSAFNQYELDSMQLILDGIKERMLPFDIEIFSSFDYMRNEVAFTSKKSMEVVIGSGSSSFLGGGAGGVAYLNTWSSSSLTSVLVFEDNLGNGNTKYVTDAAVHEAGHGFGLYHTSDYTSKGSYIREYHVGDGHVAPNMGVGYYSEYALWSNGPTYSSSKYQNDLAVITKSANNLSYRTDDHGNSTSGAYVLNPEDLGDGAELTASAGGIIEKINDADYFEFTTVDGDVDIDITTPVFGQLDPKVTLLDSNGNIIATHDTMSRSETFSEYLTTGTYYLKIESTGTYMFDSEINAYGYHLGQYNVDVTLPAAISNPRAVFDPVEDQELNETDSISITVSATDPEGEALTYWASGLPTGQPSTQIHWNSIGHPIIHKQAAMTFPFTSTMEQEQRSKQSPSR